MFNSCFDAEVFVNYMQREFAIILTHSSYV